MIEACVSLTNEQVLALVWGRPDSWSLALAVGSLGLGLVVWSYRRASGGKGRWVAAGLKTVGILALLWCLLEPLIVHERAVPGANRLVLLADSSSSLGIRDDGAPRTRGEQLREILSSDADWQVRAGQDFELVRYSFDARLQSVEDFGELAFEGDESAIASSISRLAERFRDRPVAGVLLFTDGNATDEFAADLAWDELPPIFPVVMGSEAPSFDVGVGSLAVSQTNFEESPVDLQLQVTGTGIEEEDVDVTLYDEAGERLDELRARLGDGDPAEVRFKVPAADSGVHFYRVAATSSRRGGAETEAVEATEANNSRWAVVDRGQGPYRILYVTGRPNWEFKFLRRALAEDPELELVGLVRIAKRQPKFTFRAREEQRNKLYQGFSRDEEEVAEQHDEPVLIRLGTRDQFELREGFPQSADALFAYDAVIVDDLEAGFFSPDQMSLITEFVSRRGGGFLILGGEESFLKGGYRRTPLEDLFPVYLDGAPPMRVSDGYSVLLTRDGWLEPWVRLRPTEEDEKLRLAEMPEFRTVNRVGRLKPGASVLIAAKDSSDEARPAFVTQRFGNGRTAALMLADLWRWDLKRVEADDSDLGRAWRQIMRWLVAEVPQRLEVEATRRDRDVELRVVLRDEVFEAVDNAVVTLQVQPPEGEAFETTANPSATEAGVWTATFAGREPGPYRAQVRAALADGSELGPRECGWVREPAANEFRRLLPDRGRLEETAHRTGGEVIDAAELLEFAEGLSEREVPIQQRELDPIWHRWYVFLLAIACFCAEWGWRRLKGLP